MCAVSVADLRADLLTDFSDWLSAEDLLTDFSDWLSQDLRV